MDILNLPGWKVIKVRENAHDYQVVAKADSPMIVVCPHCSNFTENRKFGTFKQIVMDLPAHGKRVGIHVKRQRYHCRKCGKTFSEALPGVSANHSATNRLIEYIGRESRDRTFVDVSRETGYTDTTIRNLFREHVSYLSKTTKFLTPMILGIDEIWLLKRPRCVLANVHQSTLYDLLSDRNKSTLQRRLMEMEHHDLVKLVAIDMWVAYRDAVRNTLPQAEIIIDLFHVVKLANLSMDLVRKRIGKQLTDRQRRRLTGTRRLLEKREADLNDEQREKVAALLKSYPLLSIAYRLKEEFYAIYGAPNEVEARQLYAEWLERVPLELRLDFKILTRAMANWEKEVFNYFNFPGTTNAFTEALNGLIKIANRLGRGYSFDVIRAKALYTDRLHKIKKPRYQRQGWDDRVLFSLQPEMEVNYGTDISTLTAEIEADEL